MRLICIPFAPTAYAFGSRCPGRRSTPELVQAGCEDDLGHHFR
ncbi:hypothetical protein SAMN05216330_11442 [Bradyrhizobium sp. Ghvi]|nr:hypothetical protein SAMN05216330_11442 [Bradyrhizobium sp. Ghvi]